MKHLLTTISILALTACATENTETNIALKLSTINPAEISCNAVLNNIDLVLTEIKARNIKQDVQMNTSKVAGALAIVPVVGLIAYGISYATNLPDYSVAGLYVLKSELQQAFNRRCVVRSSKQLVNFVKENL